MKKPYCARLFVHAYNDRDCCVDDVGQPFTGTAGVHTALFHRMREMVAEDPDRNWRQCQWVADLHVYEGAEPSPDNLVGEIDLEILRYDGAEPAIDLPEEQYICFAPDQVWHTDHSPDEIVEALGDSHDPWRAIARCGQDLTVTWLNRHSGDFEQYDIVLRGTPSQ